MKRESINSGKITFALPERFNVMAPEETGGSRMRDAKNNWAAKDEERHLIFSIAWSNVFLLTADVSIEKMLHNTERKIMKKVPCYAKIADIRKTIAGQAVCGFRYTYRAQETDMISEYLLLQYRKQNIAICSMGREGFFDENYEVFEKILSTIELH